MEKIEKHKISWAKIDSAIVKLVSSIKASDWEFDSIIGIVRGGAIPAVCLSHQFAKECILATPEQIADIVLENPDTTFLIVDELCDTGGTLKKIGKDLGSCRARWRSAVLHYNPYNEAGIIPDYLARTYDGSKWLVYPWEVE